MIQNLNMMKQKMVLIVIIYDAVPTLLADDIKTQISEQELLKDFIPKLQFKIGPILPLDPDITNQYKNHMNQLLIQTQINLVI